MNRGGSKTILHTWVVITISLVLLVILSHHAAARVTATQPSTRPATRPTTSYVYSESEIRHLNREAEVSLDLVDATLIANPPATSVSANRELGLHLFDALLHNPFASEFPAVGTFRTLRTRRTIEEMKKTTITDDSVMIWQIYNMGFVIRTKSVTLGFDLVELSHMPVIALDDGTMRDLVDQCDVLFVSHEHLDHADRNVAQWFLDQGKPVLAPQAMWQGEPIHDRLTHIPRDANPAGYPVALGQGKPTLTVTSYPGYQRLKDETSVEDNVFIVTTPESIRVAHTGDNNVPEGLPPAKSIAPVDLLIMKFDPGWLKPTDITPPFSPRLVLPAHFEELGHPNVNAREPYWRGMERAPKLNLPVVLMTWGESYRYTRPTN